MKKGEAGLTMLISVIIIIIILTQYLIFFVFFPNRNIIANEYKTSENDLLLINFVKMNSNLIVKSVKNNDFKDIEKSIQEIKVSECFEIKINEEKFSNCHIKNPEMSIITIPDYNNNPIKITMFVEKK